MKKTLIASAVAAAFSSTAFAMDPATDLAEMLEGMPEIYGNIQLAHAQTEVEVDGDTVANGNELEDNGSTLGFKHDHAITDDLTGFLKAEFEFGADDEAASGGIDTLDEAYIGVKGSFGSIQVGSDDTVYEWVDIVDNYEYIGIEGDLATQEEGDNLQYVSPEIAEMLTFGVTLPLDSDSEFGGALAATASLDIVDVTLAYGIGREEADSESGSSLGLAISAGIDDITVNFQYESKDTSSAGGVDADDDSTFLGLQGILALGASQLKLGYGLWEFDSFSLDAGDDVYGIEGPVAAIEDAEFSAIEFQALHNVSDNMYVYLEYLTGTFEQDDIEDIDTEFLILGAAYSF